MSSFVTYSNYRIVLSDPATTFGIIFIVLMIAIGITCRRTKYEFFDIPTTTSLRGIAVLFLLLGHLSIKCLQQPMFFNLGGYWAVIIFLFISGYGLYQSYRLTNANTGFWKKRILKLYIPLWITLLLFIILDDLLINLHHPLPELILNFLGFHLNDILVRVNAAAWFVEYVMVLYFIFWIVSKLPFSEELKITVLFCLCFFVSAIILLTPIRNYHSIWLQYTIVFPTGVLFGKYHSLITTFLPGKTKIRLLLIVPIFISIVVFYKWNEIVTIPGSDVLRPIALIFTLVLGSALIEMVNYQSAFLLFLGSYSYEIYLLHAPFMVKYDFFLYRKPLSAYFFAYFFGLIILSYLLAKASNMVNGSLAMLESKKHNKAIQPTPYSRG